MVMRVRETAVATSAIASKISQPTKNQPTRPVRFVFALVLAALVALLILASAATTLSRNEGQTSNLKFSKLRSRLSARPVTSNAHQNSSFNAAGGVVDERATSSHDERRTFNPKVSKLQSKPSTRPNIANVQRNSSFNAAGNVVEERCRLDLSLFSSAEVMRSAGWQFVSLDNRQFGNRFSGWGSSEIVGTLKLQFNMTGRATLRLINGLGTSTELIMVRLNRETLVQVGAKRSEQVCFRFQAGDELFITEAYGIITIHDMEVFCGKDVHGITGMKRELVDTAKTCSVGDAVRLSPPRHYCNQQINLDGKVQTALNESTAVVRLSIPSSSGSKEELRIYSAAELGCNSFSFQRRTIGLAAVADHDFKRRYQKQLQSLECFAKWRGYEFHVLDGQAEKKVCGTLSFFYQKHCIISEWLATKPSNYIAAVLDADVVAVVLERGLEHWADAHSDIQFYERVADFEIAAGNYLVRNTPWARSFLKGWSNFQYRQPPGFSSADNGAIHLHVVEVLQLEGASHCGQLYNDLGRVRHRDTAWDEYFDFVKCTKELLGGSRTWHTLDGAGSVTIWGRFQFFVVDAMYAKQIASNAQGPIMHHGVKQPAEVEGRYFTNLQHCVVNETRHVSAEAMGQAALGFGRAYTHLYTQGHGCTLCVEDCMPTFSCGPLDNDAKPKPRRKATVATLSGG